MKRFLIVVIALLALFVGALAAIPYFFKDKITAFIKDTANQNMYATLDFDNLDLSLLRNFPRVSARLEGLRIVNRAPFAGDTLLRCAAFELVADPLAYWREETVKILAVSVDKPVVYAHVLKDSSANWRISSPTAKPAAPAPAEKKSEKSSLRVALQSYSVNEGTIVFDSELDERQMALTHLNHSGKGDFAKDVFTLLTKSSARLSFAQKGVVFLKEAVTELTMNVAMDLKQKKFTFAENELKLNALTASFEGFLALPEGGDDMEMDVRFSTKNNEFKNLISLIPAVYASNFADLKSSGKASVDGYVKGVMNDSVLPGFQIHAVAENGSFQYPKLPSGVSNVEMDLTVTSPGGKSLDALVVLLKRLSLNVGNDPLAMTLEVRTPISDPFVNMSAQGRLNLANAKNLLPPEKVAGKDFSGTLTADVKFKGAVSSVKARRYADLAFSGQCDVQGVEFTSSALPQKISVREARLSFSPQSASLKNCDVRLGEGAGASDLRAEGTFDNLLGFALADETLKGTLALSSSYFDCNPWLKDSADRAKPQQSDTVFTSVELPGTVDFMMTAQMKQIKYTNLALSDAQGKLALRDKTLRLENVGAKLLGGSVVMNGSYDTRAAGAPKTTFDLKLAGFEFGKTLEAFESVRMFAPFAKYLKGSFGASIALATDLDGHLKPVWDSFNSNGGLNVTNLKIEDFKPLNQAADLLNLEFLRNPTLLKANPYYEIKNGRLYVKPFSVTLGGVNVLVSGSNGIDKSVDYTIVANVPANKLPTGLVASIPALGDMAEKLKSKPIPVTIKISGTLDNPVVKPSVAGAQEAASQALEAAQEEAKKRAQEEIEKAQQKVKEEADKKAKELEQKAKEEGEKKAKELLKDKTPSFLKNIFSKDTTKK